MDYDAIVVGGGPAGLAAALWLGRYGRRTVVIDAGEPRNEPTWAVHGFPGLPEIPPLTLRRRLREQAAAAGAEILEGFVSGAGGEKDAFTLRDEGGSEWRSHRLLLAYGRKDVVPQIQGIEAVYGTSVFHCPDCDGPTVAGQRVGVLGGDLDAAGLALFLTSWTPYIVLIPHPADGPLDPSTRVTLERHGVNSRTGRVVRLEADGAALRAAHFDDGGQIRLDALFFHLGTFPACDLAAHLGCEADRGGHLGVDRGQQTSTPGVYAAGDLTGHPYLAATAAAEGVRAALAIHRSLLPADLEIRHHQA